MKSIKRASIRLYIALAIAGLVASTDLCIIASGGISSISHLQQLNQLGVEGAIVGRALYSGDIDLKEALAAL